MKITGYRIVAENMIIAETDTKAEARELIAEFKRDAKARGEAPGTFTIETCRW